jgi:hypothetical protein
MPLKLIKPIKVYLNGTHNDVLQVKIYLYFLFRIMWGTSPFACLWNTPVECLKRPEWMETERGTSASGLC